MISYILKNWGSECEILCLNSKNKMIQFIQMCETIFVPKKLRTITSISQFCKLLNSSLLSISIIKQLYWFENQWLVICKKLILTASIIKGFIGGEAKQSELSLAY